MIQIIARLMLYQNNREQVEIFEEQNELEVIKNKHLELIVFSEGRYNLDPEFKDIEDVYLELVEFSDERDDLALIKLLDEPYPEIEVVKCQTIEEFLQTLEDMKGKSAESMYIF